MSQKRTNTGLSFGQLFASNLFPINASSTLPNGSHTQTATATKKNVAVTRLERLTFVETTVHHEPLMAHYPYINKDAMAMTMDNYRLFVANYNEKVKEENNAIEKHNAAVEQYRSKNANKLTDVQKEFSRLFLKHNSGKKTKEYNDAVEKFNADYGMLHKKEKFKTIKYATEIIFQQMIYLYSVQLAKSTNEYMKLGVSEPTPVKQMNINAWHIASIKRNEIFAVDVCTATIRNHRERLEEAGILVDYMFRGHKSGLKMNINSQILVVFDAKSGLFSNAENQSLSPKTSKDFAYNKEATRTNKNNIKKIENGVAAFLGEGTPSAVLLSSFLQEHPMQGAKVQTPAACENVKVSENLSDKLENSILHPQELAEKLAAGEFNNYQRIDKRILYKEAIYGTLTPEEFKQLIIQEFFCNAAKLYRGRNVYIGSWKKAINAYIEKLFLVNNGAVYLYNKELMVDKLQEMLWRINNAQRWFIKTKINSLFPSDYFDFSRTEKKEMGFEYTKKAYQNHLKYVQTKPLLAQKAKKNTELRKASVNHSKKFDARLNLFFKGKVSLDELIDYTTANLPAVYMEKLSEVIIKISTKYTC
ncbi:hypothetical protein [Flavobacterium sp.]|uniref:hypothetical protein n=1 Tax=Flavobacterium sp. TaxID=239 RepID=UPI00391B10CB